MTLTGWIKVPRGQSSREIGWGGYRNEEKSEFSTAYEIEKKHVREVNWIEKYENENEDGVIKHSKEQELKSRKICHEL